MKIENISDAKEVYDLLVDILDKAKKQYDLKAANGRNRHEFDNMCLTVKVNIDLLGSQIKSGCADISEIQRYVDFGVHHVYKLAKWVGEQIKKNR